jgi:NAD-dependent DNA ligase
MEPNDPSYTEWQAWQLVVSRFEALVGHINDEQYDPLVRAIEAWGELLVELRLTQSETQRTQARQERLYAAL